jgi:tRNA dimethylallyltransferase
MLHSPPFTLHPCLILLAGPTAVGKSAVSLDLAERLGGEIISVDSMQVYRGLDIGTAKPAARDRRRVPHHLIDVVDLTEPFDAAQFVRMARAAITEIQERGHVPILCGGTGLYFKAFLEGLGETPTANLELRAELEATPLPDLLSELERCDPLTFCKIDRRNPRRVIRAVEVIRLTGKPFSAHRAAWLPPGANHAKSTSAFFGLERSYHDLHQRIESRVDEMFRNGLVAETRALLDHGLAQNRTALQAIGYRQMVAHLRGERSLTDTVELVKTRTRQFAKRQLTWFRRQARLEWITAQPDSTVAAVADIIADKWRRMSDQSQQA